MKKNCGLDHKFGVDHCPVYGARCYECGESNHWKFTEKCNGGQCSKPKPGGNRGGRGRGKQTMHKTVRMKGKDGKFVTKKVNMIEQWETDEEEEEEPTR